MNKNKPQITDKQKQMALNLARRVKNNRIALLQLPTGFGKTVVTLMALRHLTRKRRRTIVISMPRKQHVDHALYINPPRLDDLETNCPWLRDLSKFGKTCHPNWGEDYIELISHKELIDIVLSPKGRNLKNYRGWERPIIAIDEIHRRPSLIEKIVNADIKSEMNYIFISATPVNPTGINELRRPYIDNGNYQEEEDKRIKRQFLSLYQSLLRLTKKGAIKKAQREMLDNIDGKISLKDFVGIHLEKAMNLIKPIPTATELHSFKPRLPPKLVLDINPIPQGEAVKKLIGYQNKANRIFEITSEDEYHNRMFLERISISGMSIEEQMDAINDVLKKSNSRHFKRKYKYSSIDPKFKKLLRTFDIRTLDYKLESVLRFLKSYYETENRPGRILIFCSYLKTAYWLSLWLESKANIWIPGKSKGYRLGGELHKEYQTMFGECGYNRFVWDGESVNNGLRDVDSKVSLLFNKSLPETCYKGLVLVTTNRYSESIDLHTKCDVLIHFEMDWSPLRMIQRVGRLWRWNAFKSRRNPGKNSVPKFPHVFHVKYPCTVDEEIYCRLQERWKKLSSLQLGLDVVPFKLAIGNDISVLG
jgi:superfamily II DNA or RNA helicase